MRAFVLLLLLLNVSLAGETPELVEVFQPLWDRRSGRLVQIHTVVCWDSHGAGPTTKAPLITAANRVPTNDFDGPEDLNLASLAGISIKHETPGPEKDLFVVDLSRVKEEEPGSSSAEVFRATLECLRLTFPKEIKNAEIEFTIPENMPVCRKIADEFLTHNKSKPFFIQRP